MIRVNLIAHDNGIGLSRDTRLLAGVLAGGGFDVTVTALARDTRGTKKSALKTVAYRLRNRLPLWRGTRPPFDINLMIERIRPHHATSARLNLLLPHPEWFTDADRAHLDTIDAVLAKTRHALDLFEALGKRTEFVGFSGEDRLLAEVPRERAFFHLAGGSENKGTRALLRIWGRHPEWPRLTLLQSPLKASVAVHAANLDHRIEYLPDDALRRLQNAHAFHLCPSETEGFGHYLVEAMSVGALVVSVDAPPMNELVTPERGVLVPYAYTGTQRLATTYHVDEAQLESAIGRIIAMPDAHWQALGARARAWYVDNDARFRQRIVAVLRDLA
jgi:hypothetical protein